MNNHLIPTNNPQLPSLREDELGQLSPYYPQQLPERQILVIECRYCYGLGKEIVVIKKAGLLTSEESFVRPCPVCGGKGFVSLR